MRLQVGAVGGMVQDTNEDVGFSSNHFCSKLS